MMIKQEVRWRPIGKCLTWSTEKKLKKLAVSHLTFLFANTDCYLRKTTHTACSTSHRCALKDGKLKNWKTGSGSSKRIASEWCNSLQKTAANPKQKQNWLLHVLCSDRACPQRLLQFRHSSAAKQMLWSNLVDPMEASCFPSSLFVCEQFFLLSQFVPWWKTSCSKPIETLSPQKTLFSFAWNKTQEWNGKAECVIPNFTTHSFWFCWLHSVWLVLSVAWNQWNVSFEKNEQPESSQQTWTIEKKVFLWVDLNSPMLNFWSSFVLHMPFNCMNKTTSCGNRLRGR